MNVCWYLVVFRGGGGGSFRPWTSLFWPTWQGDGVSYRIFIFIFLGGIGEKVRYGVARWTCSQRTTVLSLVTFSCIPSGVMPACAIVASPGEDQRAPVIEMAACRWIASRRLVAL